MDQPTAPAVQQPAPTEALHTPLSVPAGNPNNTSPIKKPQTGIHLPKVLIIAFICVILLFGIASAGVYYILNEQVSKITQQNRQGTAPTAIPPTASPTPSLTASWNTYTTFQKYITFQYPQNWYISDIDDLGASFLYAFFTSKENALCTQPNSSCERIAVFVYPHPEKNEKVINSYEEIASLEINVPKMHTSELEELGITRSITTRKPGVVIGNTEGLVYTYQIEAENKPSLNDDIVYNVKLKSGDVYYSFYFPNEDLQTRFISSIKLTANNIDENEAVMCTLDAKVCPDGSSVGRLGPNCEFAACPQ